MFYFETFYLNHSSLLLFYDWFMIWYNLWLNYYHDWRDIADYGKWGNPLTCIPSCRLLFPLCLLIDVTCSGCQGSTFPQGICRLFLLMLCLLLLLAWQPCQTLTSSLLFFVFLITEKKKVVNYRFSSITVLSWTTLAMDLI